MTALNTKKKLHSLITFLCVVYFFFFFFLSKIHSKKKMIKKVLGLQSEPPPILTPPSKVVAEYKGRVSLVNQPKFYFASIIQSYIDPQNGLVGFVLGHMHSHLFVDGFKGTIVNDAKNHKVMNTILLLRDLKLCNRLTAQQNVEMRTFLDQFIHNPSSFVGIRIIDREVGVKINDVIHTVWRGDILLIDPEEKKQDEKVIRDLEKDLDTKIRLMLKYRDQKFREAENKAISKLQNNIYKGDVKQRRRSVKQQEHFIDAMNQTIKERKDILARYLTREGRDKEEENIKILRSQLKDRQVQFQSKDYHTASLREILVQRKWGEFQNKESL